MNGAYHGQLTILDDEQRREEPPANAKVRRQTALPVSNQVTRTRQINSSGGADDYPRAVLFMLLAAVFLPLLNAAVKYLSGRYPVLELLWARYAGHLGFMLVVFAPRRGLTLLRSARPVLQVSRSTPLAPFVLGERVGAARAVAVGVGFLGAMVV